MAHPRTETHRSDLEKEVFADGEEWVEGDAEAARKRGRNQDA
jgi:hypothetical protein